MINESDNVSSVLGEANINNFMLFMEKHGAKSRELSSKLLDLKAEMEALDKKVKVAEENLMELDPKNNADETQKERSVSILMEGEKACQVTLVLSYVVMNASWTPFYDVRAYNKDDSVQVIYFGLIQQNSGEDWLDTQISLSTAMPSVGGSPPKLKPVYLDVERYRPVLKSAGLLILK
jgi:uncharacterized protein (TIGR02231 family)